MQVIILCGGKGTRLREETEYKPKPMIEIGGKPILWHIMKLYACYGHKEFILALGYKGSIIRDYFINYNFYNSDFTLYLSKHEKYVMHSNHDEHDWKVTLVETGTESMTGYRVKLCQKFITEEDFLLTYGDAVSNIDLYELVKFHEEQNTIGTVTGVYPPSRFGDLIVSGDYVKIFKEKLKDTENTNPINGGFFVFKKEFFDLIPDEPECDLERKPIDVLTNKKELSIFKHKGFWQCMDTYRDFKMLNEMWQNNPQWKIWE